MLRKFICVKYEIKAAQKVGIMADAEQFSLRWNNFHSNLSEGFHSLLEEVDLVDVTLAAEGQYLQAHKLVLSVCSPYFKQLFKANPCKHPIVILKDVCHKDLEALLQFMYQGEVNVRQEELAPFLKTAEMLQIKGLTGNDSKSNMPESPSQTRVQTPPPPTLRVGRDSVKQESQNAAETSRPFKRQRTESPHIGTGSLTSSAATLSAPATTATTSQPSAMSPTEPANVEFVPISNPKLEPLEYDNEADGNKESPADLVQLLHSNESSQPPPDLPPAAPPVLFNPVAGLPQDSGGSQDSMQGSYNGNSDDAVCPLCGKILRKTSLKRHITDRHNPGQYVPCKICVFDHNVLLIHAVLSGLRIVDCVCVYIIYFKKSLCNTSLYEIKFNIRCCGKFLKYFRYHPPNEDIFKYLRYQCEICQKFFTRRDHLTTHFKNLHGEDAGPFSCIVCSQLYKNADSGGKQTVERVGPLASNAQPPKEFVCSVCGKNFIRKGSLHAHFQNIHGILQGPFPCGLCGSLLKNKKSLDTHMLSHKKNLFKH
ncbi:Longitudinals lacking protein-like [Gryllus bimaculatus]|nr:Longitudinals lacking protein-like [Gryllus bimaculatus]